VITVEDFKRAADFKLREDFKRASVLAQSRVCGFVDAEVRDRDVVGADTAASSVGGSSGAAAGEEPYSLNYNILNITIYFFFLKKKKLMIK
jgi:hypothetical protein